VAWPDDFTGIIPDYNSIGDDELAAHYHKCTPFEACVGLPDDVGLVDCERDEDTGNYAKCGGASGEDRCSRGYEGNRCSECEKYDPTKGGCSATDTEPNGYYRLDQFCEPCECSWFTPTKIALIASILLVIVMVTADHLMKEVDHMSTVFAPIMIAVTFFQTLALLLDLDVAWPPALRRWMSNLNILNVNLELARPECSGEFGVMQKLKITLFLPVGVALLLAVYVAVQYGLSKRMTPSEFRAKHGGRDVIAHLSRQLLTATVAAFMLGSIFFLRNILLTWDCTPEETPGGPRYVRSEPVIECNLDNDKYSTLYAMSSLGLTVYLGMFGTFAFGLTVKRDLFEFLGDKFEDAYFYWELVLLLRKILVMASFLFFASMTETAWFFGSAVVVFSLMIHCAARPYEDELIDWCELLSLLSTLFIFQAGLVFKVLNDPAKPETSQHARSISDALEMISMALIASNVFLATFIEIRVWKHVRDGEEDYRVRMINRQIEANKQQMEELLAGVSRAKALADERAAHRAAMHNSGKAARVEEEEFDNPVADGEGDEEAGKANKTSKKKDKK
jgi:hypothetical protein